MKRKDIMNLEGYDPTVWTSEGYAVCETPRGGERGEFPYVLMHEVEPDAWRRVGFFNSLAEAKAAAGNAS
jgi:hypothetical protein